MRTVRGPSDRVVVVGAGFAGLAAALHLAGRGREVTVVEREDWPGGRAGRLDIDGYRLDTGPTVLTMPDIIDDTFAAVGETTSSRLDLLAVDPAYRAQFADGAASMCTAMLIEWPPRSSSSLTASRPRAIGGCVTG